MKGHIIVVFAVCQGLLCYSPVHDKVRAVPQVACHSGLMTPSYSFSRSVRQRHCLSAAFLLLIVYRSRGRSVVSSMEPGTSLWDML